MIWITPVWRRDETWDAARRGRLESLYVVGSADHDYHLADRHTAVPGKTLTLADADHRLEISGDVMATLNAWRSTVAAIIDFASRRDALDPECFSISV
jgi:hypothetical protein